MLRVAVITCNVSEHNARIEQDYFIGVAVHLHYSGGSRRVLYGPSYAVGHAPGDHSSVKMAPVGN